MAKRGNRESKECHPNINPGESGGKGAGMYQELFDLNPSPAAVFSTDGRCLLANRAFSYQLGYDQGALLSYEDLAMLLTTSPATVKRDVALLRRQGLFIMTRGTKHDMGPGLSHKTIILDLYFNGYTFSEIEQKTNHSETSVKRYLADFVQVATLYKQNFTQQQIRLIAKKSDRIVREYIQLYQTYHKQDNQRLDQLLTPATPGEEAKKKSTSQSVHGGEKNE